MSRPALTTIAGMPSRSDICVQPELVQPATLLSMALIAYVTQRTPSTPLASRPMFAAWRRARVRVTRLGLRLGLGLGFGLGFGLGLGLGLPGCAARSW